MLATLIDAPFDDDGWSFETKWDGVRALCAVERGHVTLTSRTGHDLLAQFPELQSLRAAFRRLPILVDGEICDLDAQGRSSFQRLQQRLNRIDGAAGHDGRRATYVVFDLLAAGGQDLRKRPLEQRQRILGEILKPVPHVLLSKPIVGTGRRLFSIAKKRGWEGIIGKRRDSPYQSRRSRDWVKIKTINEQEAVIVGWTDPRGSRAHFGALFMGLYDDGNLQFVGKVGTGFDRSALREVYKRMKPLEVRKPAISTVNVPHAHWVKPLLVAELKFGEWTRDGIMRQSVFLGLRNDKPARECVREKPRSR